MNCPECGFPNQTKVIDTRPTSYGVYRRRRCLMCDATFGSVELVVPQDRSKEEILRIIDKTILKGKTK